MYRQEKECVALKTERSLPNYFKISFSSSSASCAYEKKERCLQSSVTSICGQLFIVIELVKIHVVIYSCLP